MFSELITMTVTVTDPDFNFLNSIGNNFVTNGNPARLVRASQEPPLDAHHPWMAGNSCLLTRGIPQSISA